MGSLGDHAIPGRAGGSTAGPGRDRTSIGPCRSRRAERWDKPTAAGLGRQPPGFVDIVPWTTRQHPATRKLLPRAHWRPLRAVPQRHCRRL